jgi:decaprenyl-phosphate phosphoribosyltransferase
VVVYSHLFGESGYLRCDESPQPGAMHVHDFGTCPSGSAQPALACTFIPHQRAISPDPLKRPCTCAIDLHPAFSLYAPRMIYGILKSMRPHQWVKNAFVLAPVVFAGSFDDVYLLARAVAAAALFSVVSGSVYLLNDVLDVEKDRAHPVKRNRPVASGRVPIPVARVASAVLATLALALGFWLAPLAGACLATYLVLNLAYSVRLKHIAWLDLAIIATGFVIRVLTGGFATGIHISVWLLACTFLLATYLGLGKRRHELRDEAAGGTTRKSLQHYSEPRVAKAMAFTAVATVSAYSAYTFSQHARDVFGSPWVPVTIPFICFGIVRFYTLTGRTDTSASPTDRMVTDPLFVSNIFIWGLLVLGLIYL